VNNRLHFAPPRRLDTAKELVGDPTVQYAGKPTLLAGKGAIQFLNLRESEYGPYNDGMLFVDGQDCDRGTVGKDDQRPLANSTTTVTMEGGDVVYTINNSNSNFTSFAIPYEKQRTPPIGIYIAGPDMLPVEGIISEYGNGVDGLAHVQMRWQILARSHVRFSFRTFAADHSVFRSVRVLDAAGSPLAGAILTYGSQVFGRSDSTGLLEFPWPGPIRRSVGDRLTETIREELFFVSAPGLVPVILERSELESANAPVEVTLRAQELLVSVHHKVARPGALQLANNPDVRSDILTACWDLRALPEAWTERTDWQSAREALGVNEQTFMPLPRALEHWDTGEELAEFHSARFSQVLGRSPSPHWSQYAHWYFGRWDYDELEGRLDVVLPFAGRFLLLVGEYNRGEKGELTSGVQNLQINGKLTHILYIDASNPADLKSALFVHPLG